MTFSFQLSQILRLTTLVVAMAGVSSVTGATEESFDRTIEKKVGYRFLLDLPEGYDSQQEPWPLLIFLHGAGERGDQLDKVKVHGPPKEVAAGRKLPFIIASPQCPAGEVWDADAVVALVDHLSENWKVDKDRVYLTGLSLGGYGTWETGIAYPERFAALVPICGGAGVRFIVADRLKNMPVWCFHGAKDSTVPLSLSEQMMARLKGSSADVRFTVYPEAGHDSWTESYANDELYEWLLAQKRKPADSC
jgi:predicted peptidase